MTILQYVMAGLKPGNLSFGAKDHRQEPVTA
jgi:hypothetical protein